MLQVRAIAIVDANIVVIRIDTETIVKADASHLVPAEDMTIALVAEMIVRTGIDAGTSQVTDPDGTMAETTETDQEAVEASAIAREIETGPGVTATTVTTETGTRGGTGIVPIMIVGSKNMTTSKAQNGHVSAVGQPSKKR